ncbi:hypothetical protein PIB30_092520 [Stylosanthes scabra]|uniref:Uncharacterized protein n=1 Tax=Stylosanthes scabra TaxID=79078 RepID=A0ABU6WYC7_9FABA|nr:hypothetical protein [Stylosanthes scabra]
MVVSTELILLHQLNKGRLESEIVSLNGWPSDGASTTLGSGIDLLSQSNTVVIQLNFIHVTNAPKCGASLDLGISNVVLVFSTPTSISNATHGVPNAHLGVSNAHFRVAAGSGLQISK